MLQNIRHPDDIREEQTRKARDKVRKQTQKQGAREKRQPE